MAQVRHAIETLERIAPKRLAFDFDRVGLQVGNPSAELTRGVVSLDRSLAAVEFAAERSAQLLVSHHPLIFEPLPSVVATEPVGRTVLELARRGIAFAAAHTNWDCARGGINDALASRLGLTDVEPFGSSASEARLKMAVFCPPAAAEAVIDAASMAGAGSIGAYERCAFETPGTGTFLGGAESHPVIGRPGKIERTPEVRVEMVLSESRRSAVEAAVRGAHPYEEPAIDFFVLSPLSSGSIGRVGSLKAGQNLGRFVGAANAALGTACLAWGDPARLVRRLAVIGGSGDSDWRKAREAGADALLTGEVKQHIALEADEEGFALIAAGHYATEQPGCAALRDRLEEELPEIKWSLFEPMPGGAGRPLS